MLAGSVRGGGLAHRIDVTVGGVTASTLPGTMVFSHLTLTGPALGLRVTYLVLGQKRFA